MKGHLKVFKSEQKIDTESNSRLVKQFKEHLGTHLANKLTFQFERFQMFQKMFASILYDRQNELKETLSQKLTHEEVSLETETIQSHPAPLQQQVVLDETDQNLLKERDQEIDRVVQDVNYISDVMNQIQVMTIEQGTLLDRIDVNLDSTRQDLRKAIGKLEKRAERFSVHQKRLIIFTLALLIFATSLALFFKR